jgi:toxin ParE1/3/4
MPNQYRLTRLAEQDIDSIAQYIAKDSLKAANKFTDEVERICQTLAQMPDLGTEVSFIKSQQFQFFPVGKFQNFLIFYRLLQNTPEIVRVLHRHRNIEDLFEE